MRVTNTERQRYEAAAALADRFGYYVMMGHLRYVAQQAVAGEDVDTEDAERAARYSHYLEQVKARLPNGGVRCAACEGDDGAGHTCDQ